jgi:hypothetical protein
MLKVDLKRELKHLYQPAATRFELVDVPPMSFLMVDGRGDPNIAPEYGEAIEALFSLSYTLKFTVKKEMGVDYGVMPLEGLWWAENMEVFATGDKDAWDWTAMIMQPEWVSAEMVEEARGQLARKKSLPALPRCRFECYHEGLSVQIMHVGPYAAEAPTIERMHGSFIPEHGYVPGGKHHEIYLSDPGRTAPEKLKTIIRQPVLAREGA